VSERWRRVDSDAWQDAESIIDAIDSRVSRGELTTWLESDSGRIVGWVTNRERVMLMVMDRPGDAGEHAIDPDAPGSSSGFVLENGQSDEYADRDTVTTERARRILRSVLTTGQVPPGEPWEVDRG
jgi:hypothetical protein